jgi:PPK2 family polyphosphate:nucleotide phosphotransferase
MSHSELYRINKNFKLGSVGTLKKPGSTPEGNESKAQLRQEIIDLAQTISEHQNVFFAQRKHKLLIILQGMDTSGKDGTIRAVFGAVNPLGARSVAFKAPSAIELEHDYLWRVHKEVPHLGELVIFNRSHYEDVLITRVHNWIDHEECVRRYAHIRDFERMLTETGTIILKFFLHISRDEQKRRIEERLTDPDKQWKFDPQDLAERAYWDQYQAQYEKVLNETDCEHAPWHVIPADSKTQRNLAIARIVEEKLASLKLSYPKGQLDYSKIKVD